MRDLNKVILSGRATKDAEYKEVNGTRIATFTLACNFDEYVSYLPVTCFGALAENVVSQYVTKGKALHVEGRLRQERFETKEGQYCSKVTIIAQNITLQGGGKRCQEEDAQTADVT